MSVKGGGGGEYNGFEGRTEGRKIGGGSPVRGIYANLQGPILDTSLNGVCLINFAMGARGTGCAAETWVSGSFCEIQPS